MIVTGLNNIGVSLGSDNNSVTDSIFTIKQLEHARLLEDNTQDLKSRVLDQEEKHLADEEEVDRNLCNDIMDEVLDGGSEQFVLARTEPVRDNSSSKNKKRKNKKNNNSS